MPLATVEVSTTKLTATYYEADGCLELFAEGKKPMIGDPQFTQLPWYGGLKFKLAGAYLGPYPEVKFPPTPYAASYKLKINLPVQDFSNNVLVETKDGVKTVPIDYTNSTDVIPNNSDKDNFVDVLPPIGLTIEGDFSNTITAEVPPKNNDFKLTVHIEFNPQFIKVVSTIAEDGTIKWTLAWNHYPVGQRQSPQIVDVITHKVWRAGSVVNSSRVIQPYNISITNIPVNKVVDFTCIDDASVF